MGYSRLCWIEQGQVILKIFNESNSTSEIIVEWDGKTNINDQKTRIWK